MEYEVTWGDGPLGLTLRPDLGEDMPPVVGRITRQDSAAALAKVAVGHMLVSINGMDTARQGYDHVVETLQKIPRPATLRFRVPRAITGAPSASPSTYRDPSRSASRRSRGSTGTTWSETNKSTSSAGSTTRRREQYTVVWTEGPLGMILRPDDDDCHVPCIRKITGKGAGTGMERATVGDVLVAVNGQETKSLGFRSTISLLKTIRKPAVLKFKRMGRRISRKRSSQESPGGSRSVSGIPSDIGSYDIVWREGDLGLKLKPGYRDVPVLSKLTGKGNASGLQNAQVGDELVSVNGTAVEGEAYQDTLRMLKHSPKPAVLRFRPGKNRRESMMSVASVTSVRSNPSTQREVTNVASRQHVPLYEHNTIPPEPMGPPPPLKTSRTDRERTDRERQKRKKRIPLDVARELVAASQGSDLDHAIFAGIPITAIEEGSKEAHLLRVQAKLCISNQAKAERNTPAKEALSRAEQEAKVLQEALEKVKNQAKKYEEILEAQSRERVLALAVRHKPEEVVKRQNNVIHELAGVISGFKRDSYADVDIVPPVLEENEHVQKIMDDLQNVMSIPVVVPTAKFCAECGTTENESKLDMDEDGEYYCKDCWDKFLNEDPTAEAPAPAPTPVQEPAVVAPASPPAPSPVEEEEVSPPASLHDAPSRSMNRLTIEDREAEEQKARVEAERKLMEIKELRRSGSMLPERPLHKNNSDRSRRERRGLEELAQALLEEEERARAEGNLGLAKKLSAQRARTMAETSGESPHPGMTPFSSMGNLLANHNAEFRNGHGSPMKSKSASPVPVDTPLALSRSISADSSLPPPVPVSVSPATSPEPMPSPVAAKNHHHEIAAGAAIGTTAAVAAAVAMDSPTTTAEATASSSGGNDYADVNSDEEAEDQMHMRRELTTEKYDEMDGDVGLEKERAIRALFCKQMQLPLGQNDLAMSEFRAWDAYNTLDSEATGLMLEEASQQQSKVFAPLMKKLRGFEARIGATPGTEDAAAPEQAWQQYLNFVKHRVAPLIVDEKGESKTEEGKRVVACLYERAISVMCLSPTLWASYLEYLEPDQTGANKSKGGDGDKLAVARRAVRNIPFDSSAWTELLIEMERAGKSTEEISWLVRSQLLARLSPPMDQFHFLNVLLTWCDSVRRHASTSSGGGALEESVQKVESLVEDVFSECELFISKTFPDFLEGKIRLAEYQAKCYWVLMPPVGATRLSPATAMKVSKVNELWKTTLSAPLGDQAATWVAYLESIQRMNAFSVKDIRAKVINEAVQRVKDAQIVLAEAWLVFERENGDLVNYLRAKQYHAKHRAAVQATPAQITAPGTGSTRTEGDKKPKNAKKRKSNATKEENKQSKGLQKQPAAKRAKLNNEEADTISMTVDKTKIAKTAEKKKVHESMTNEHTLFLCNVSKDASKEDIEALFSDIPTLKDVRLVVKTRGDRVKSRGMAYVQFTDEAGVEAGLTSDGALLHGHPLRVERSKPPPTSASTAPGKPSASKGGEGFWKTDPLTLYVGDLSRDGSKDQVTEEQLQVSLQQTMQSAGELVVVTRVSILKDRHGKLKNYGLVEVAEPSQVSFCLANVTALQAKLGDQVTLKPSRFSIAHILEQQEKQQKQKQQRKSGAVSVGGRGGAASKGANAPHARPSTRLALPSSGSTTSLMPRALRRKLAAQNNSVKTETSETAATVTPKSNEDFRKMLFNK